MANSRQIKTDGPHTTEVLRVLSSDVKEESARKAILTKATDILKQSVDPNAPAPALHNDGLLYGLIQSGKTSIITVAAALAADNGFDCILILTSDIDLLYDQTRERIQRALRGLPVLGKDDWKDHKKFKANLKTLPVVVVCSKNGLKLNSLLDAYKKAGTGKLSTF